MADLASKDGVLMLCPTQRYVPGGRHRFTQAMRARTLREELEYRLQNLADLLYDVRRAPDDPEEVEVVAIAQAVEHLRAAVDAIEHATHGSSYTSA